MDTATLGLKIDASGAVDAVKALNSLAEAAERASNALDNLAGKAHGGITVLVVGAVARVDIKATGQEESQQELADEAQSLNMGY